VEVTNHGDRVEVVVEDDGPGAGPRAAHGSGSGYGLAGLAERAQLYGGALEAGPRSVGAGWRVRLTLPVRTGMGSDRAEAG
jgi:signal transduction histidine kinase